MGSSLSQLLCCVPCQRRSEQQAAEPSETKPVLRSPGDSQPPTPALKIPSLGSKELSQERQPSAGALEESGELCCAAEPPGRAGDWEAAWNPVDFFVAPTDEEVEGEAEGLTQQQKVGNEEGMQPVPDVPAAAVGAAPVAQEEQPGTEGAPGAGITLQEGNSASLIELGGEDEPGQGWETAPPAGSCRAPALLGWELSLCAVPGQPEHLCAAPTGGTGRARAAATSPLSSVSLLAEAMARLNLQSPAEATARAEAELCSPSAVLWQPLCPQWASLEPPEQLLELLEQGMQGSLAPGPGCAGLAGLSETLQQLQDGALGELGQEGSRGCTPGAEAEDGIVELPEETAASAPAAVNQEAELPHVPPSVPEVLGSSGEREAENAEA